MPRPRTTIRQLSYFVALADTGSFTRAAEQMGVSQPSLSQQIRGLETIIGAPLFERGGPAILTPLGRELLARARSILLDLADLEDVRATSADSLIGTIRLGVSPTLGAYLMPSLVARLHREHPALRVHVREGLPTVLASDLATGVHDVILAQLPVAGRGLHSERLFREPLHVTMAADHPLRTKACITPADLRGANLLTLMPEYRLAEQVAAIAAEVGANVLRDYEGTSLDAIRQMAGMAWAWRCCRICTCARRSARATMWWYGRSRVGAITATSACSGDKVPAVRRRSGLSPNCCVPPPHRKILCGK